MLREGPIGFKVMGEKTSKAEKEFHKEIEVRDKPINSDQDHENAKDDRCDHVRPWFLLV